MTEEFLYYIWKYRLLSDQVLKSTAGEEIKLLYPGDRNHDQGPDFRDARVIIDGVLWAGNVEIHVKSSDYFKHGHAGDPLYESIVLHVVYEEDVKIGDTVCLELKQRIDPVQFERYHEFVSSKEWLSCGNSLAAVNPIIVRAWTTRMAVERLEAKSLRIAALYEQTTRSWEETLYILLARGYGFSVNAEPFEALARKVPYMIIRKYRHRLVQVEALLFGMAGMLDEHFTEPYVQLLQNEFKSIGRRLTTPQLQKHYWKYHRMRPANFPDLRIAQMAAVIAREQDIFSMVIGLSEMDKVIECLSVIPSAYWNDHFRLGHASEPQGGMIGQSSCEGLMINAVIPFLFFYGKEKKVDSYCEKAITWLELLHAEQNRLVKRFGFVGVKCLNAADTQGLIHLEKHYCSKRRCLECVIGRKLINEQS